MDRGAENSYEPNHIKGSFSIQAAVSFKTDLCLLRVYCMRLHIDVTQSLQCSSRNAFYELCKPCVKMVDARGRHFSLIYGKLLLLIRHQLSASK